MTVNNEAIVKVKLLGYFKEQLMKIFAPKDKATTTKEGLMSKEDKAKLDGIQAGATNYQHPSTHSADMIAESTTRKWLTPQQVTDIAQTKATAADTKSKFEAHVAEITEVTDTEVKTMLDDAGLTEIA